MKQTVEAIELAELGFTQHFAAQLPLDEALEPARVLRLERSGLEVRGRDFSLHLTLGANWFRGDPEDRPTVGDWLLLDAERRPRSLLERSTCFTRRSGEAGVQLVAANIDTALLVTACNQEFNVARLERYLSLVRSAGATPVVVLTKADLVDDVSPWVDAVRALSASLAVEVASGLDPSSLDGLRAWCRSGSTLALLGSSGVGKSTLLNGLVGASVQDTGAARADDDRGRHTTSSRSLHRLPGGAWMLDAPGMRELGLVDAADGVRETFDVIAELAAGCRFADCAHDGEPGCAVQAAIDAGSLDAERLKRFHKLEREERYASETIAEARARYRRFGRMTRDAMAHKRPRE